MNVEKIWIKYTEEKLKVTGEKSCSDRNVISKNKKSSINKTGLERIIEK